MFVLVRGGGVERKSTLVKMLIIVGGSLKYISYYIHVMHILYTILLYIYIHVMYKDNFVSVTFKY